MYEMHPITLSFPKDEEYEFRKDYFQKSLNQMRIALIVGVILMLSFGIYDELFSDVKLKMRIIRYAFLCPIILATFLFTYTSYFKRGAQAILCCTAVLVALGVIAMSMVTSQLFYLYYAGLILLIIYLHTFFKLRFLYASVTSWFIFAAYLFAAIWITPTPLPILTSNILYLFSVNVIGMFSSYLLEFYIRKEYAQSKLLEAEKEKSEKLLLNILPKGIAERLKQANSDMAISFSQVIVDKFPDVTVLFADIVEFTSLSSRISPESLVVFLNELFSTFDSLAERHGLEKIKTIGDAYMAVGGLPDPLPNHAEAVAEMALDMQGEVAKIEAAKEGWLRIRIGIHTGAVVAGVIGRRKFSYDLWGNTVNVASRMEHYSVAGNILVSEETYRRLQDKYLFVERGRIEVKGKGA